jgi:hypothetical protein
MNAAATLMNTCRMAAFWPHKSSWLLTLLTCMQMLLAEFYHASLILSLAMCSPYNYGHKIEVAVDEKGNHSLVKKWRTMGRHQTELS